MAWGVTSHTLHWILVPLLVVGVMREWKSGLFLRMAKMISLQLECLNSFICCLPSCAYYRALIWITVVLKCNLSYWVIRYLNYTVGSYYGFIAYWKFDTRFTRGRALSIIIPTAHAIKLLLYYINPPRNDFLIESAKAANMLVCSGQRRSCGGVVTRLVRIGKNYHRGFLLPPLSWGGKVLPFWRTLFNFIFLPLKE